MQQTYTLRRVVAIVVTKERRIVLRATRLEVAAWRMAAEEAGLSFSEWLRQSARRELAVPYQAHPSLIAQPRVAA